LLSRAKLFHFFARTRSRGKMADANADAKKADANAVAHALMTRAVAAHKAGKPDEAEALYRETLGVGPHPGAAILLANLLISTHVGRSDYPSRRTDALLLARASMKGVESRAPGERLKLQARFAYFLLQYTGHVQLVGEQLPSSTTTASSSTTEGEGAALGGGQRSALLAEAIACLEAALEADPTYTLGWRNLTLALTAADRLVEAETAAGKAVVSAGGSAQPGQGPGRCRDWELLYKHGKALKRVGKLVEGVRRYCDAADGSAGAAGSEVVFYWLRIADAAPPPGSTSEDTERVKRVLGSARASSSSSSSSAASSSFVPHEYVRKLFDGYSKKFDAHLVGALGYRTPKAILDLALAAAGVGAGAGASAASAAPSQRPPPALLWRRCADLGCGTGLAGVEFRPYVGYLSGCDLSGGMVAEARARGLYDELGVEEIEAWLAAHPTVVVDGAGGAGGEGAAAAPGPLLRGGFDLVVAADVLVYIGPLEGVFRRTAESMVPTGGGGADPSPSPSPSLFVFSTEALGAVDGGDVASTTGPGYALSHTGRCVHSRPYVLGLAREYGFVVRGVTRQAIRKNAGEDVIGDVFVLEFVGGGTRAVEG
jgi:predicted TPR repeat methyltransferase